MDDTMPDREAYELRISLLKEQLELQITLRKKAETKSLMYNNRLNNLRKKIANYFGVTFREIKTNRRLGPAECAKRLNNFENGPRLGLYPTNF